MRHFIIFKYGRCYFEKVYEYYGDFETARKFQKNLSENMHCILILMEVL